MIRNLILTLSALYLFCLAVEAFLAARHRRAIGHVVYVNGTRGKSTVTRLIDAGLRAGGLRVFCKTTGTDPIMRSTDGTERPVRRRGRANIREQLAMLSHAAHEGADVLVIECMAVDPTLQWVSQHKMLRADIGVITNVRLDHTAEMGKTLPEICTALCSTIPKNGVLLTADAVFFPQMRQRAAALGSEALLVDSDAAPPELDFPENVALALAVCERLGVKRSEALGGMRHYSRDPYALSLFRLPGGALFINGLSINDPESTERVLCQLRERYSLAGRPLILLLNNRPDRGYRTEQMAVVAARLQPAEVWLLGAAQWALRRRLKNLCTVRGFTSASALPLEALTGDTVLYAAGNIASQGRALMARVEREGKPGV